MGISQIVHLLEESRMLRGSVAIAVLSGLCLMGNLVGPAAQANVQHRKVQMLAASAVKEVTINVRGMT